MQLEMIAKFPKSANLYQTMVEQLQQEKKAIEDQINAGSLDQNYLTSAIAEVQAAFERANSTILNISSCEKKE